MHDVNEHVVLETEDLDEARAARRSIMTNFAGRRYWICIIKSATTHRVTLANNWGARLTDDEAQPVIDFVSRFRDEPVTKARPSKPRNN